MLASGDQVLENKNRVNPTHTEQTSFEGEHDENLKTMETSIQQLNALTK